MEDGEDGMKYVQFSRLGNRFDENLWLDGLRCSTDRTWISAEKDF